MQAYHLSGAFDIFNDINVFMQEKGFLKWKVKVEAFHSYSKGEYWKRNFYQTLLCD